MPNRDCELLSAESFLHFHFINLNSKFLNEAQGTGWDGQRLKVDTALLPNCPAVRHKQSRNYSLKIAIKRENFFESGTRVVAVSFITGVMWTPSTRSREIYLDSGRIILSHTVGWE